MTKFNVAYIDPPWTYKNKKTGGSMKSGAEAKYDGKTMSLQELIDLRPLLDKVTAKDIALFLWVTTPTKADYPEKLLKAWGYKYKTTLYWHKIRPSGKLGLGYWYRGDVEECYLAIRGKVKAFRYPASNFISTPIGKHSHKPIEMRRLIEKGTINMPDRNMLELFATERVDGWTSLGYEIDGKDIRVALEELNVARTSNA